jgi:hypothetical protein
MGWATFWADFSQTHPVTLPGTSAIISQGMSFSRGKKRRVGQHFAFWVMPQVVDKDVSEAKFNFD